jgi:phospholipase C
MPTQEPGTRPSRPVPYKLEAWAKPDGQNLVLTLRNFGTRSAHFTIYPYAAELPAPKHLDVLGLQIVRIPLPDKKYEIEVHGPAGFKRTFKN